MTSNSVAAARRKTNYERFRRPTQETIAMSARKRSLVRALIFWKCSFTSGGREEEPSSQQTVQYRIPPKSEKMGWRSMFTSSVESVVMKYTLWNYRTTFARSVFGFFLLYFVIVHLFAILLWGLVAAHHSVKGRECLTGWNLEPNQQVFVDNFFVAFASSWTTLSTVGYGAVAPPDDEQCHLIRMILALEAFVGLVFSGMCSAILFAKIQRVELGASIKFSSCLCLQFGEGVTEDRVNIVESIGELGHSSSDVAPFPVLEMRLVNTTCKTTTRGDASENAILDASVKCVATSLRLIGAADSNETEGFSTSGATNNIQDNESHVQVGSDSDQQLRLKRKFEEMKMSPAKHPIFSRGAMYCRHILDADSPLLRSSVKQRIRDIGSWPSDLDSATKIQSCLSKDIYEINVTFTGTSNFTSDSVFKMHSYKPKDLYVGWTFAKLGYISERNIHDDEPEIKTDLSLLHDIVPQKGGGCEPLGSMRKSQASLMSFLASVAEE